MPLLLLNEFDLLADVVGIGHGGPLFFRLVQLLCQLFQILTAELFKGRLAFAIQFVQSLFLFHQLLTFGRDALQFSHHAAAHIGQVLGGDAHQAGRALGTGLQGLDPIPQGLVLPGQGFDLRLEIRFGLRIFGLIGLLPGVLNLRAQFQNGGVGITRSLRQLLHEHILLQRQVIQIDPRKLLV